MSSNASKCGRSLRTLVSLLLAFAVAGSSLLAVVPSAGAITITDVTPPDGFISSTQSSVQVAANLTGPFPNDVTVDTYADWSQGTVGPTAALTGGGVLGLFAATEDDFSGNGGPNPILWDSSPNAVLDGNGGLVLSSNSAGGVLEPYIRGNLSTSSYDWRVANFSTTIFSFCYASVDVLTSYTSVFVCGLWNSYDAYLGILAQEDGAGGVEVTLVGYSSNDGWIFSGVAVQIPFGTTEQYSLQVGRASGFQYDYVVFGQRRDAVNNTWQDLGKLIFDFDTYTSWGEFAGRDMPVDPFAPEDVQITVDKISFAAPHVPTLATYLSAPLNTGLLPGADLQMVHMAYSSGDSSGIGSFDVRFAPNDTGPWTSFTGALLDQPISLEAGPWVQFQIVLRPSSSPAQTGIDRVQLTFQYPLDIGTYWYDDFPAGPAGAINPDSWSLSSTTTFAEGLDLDSGSPSPSVGVTAKNATWDLSRSHRADGVVAVRVVGGSDVQVGGAGDEHVLLNGFTAAGAVQDEYVGVVRVDDGASAYWAIASSTGIPPGACDLPPVALGAAASFGVLAATSVNNNGATTVSGDLGVSPGVDVFGFPPGVATGGTYVGDATAAAAIGDLATAMADASSRTACSVSLGAEIGGMTLAPGLYAGGNYVQIGAGDLTLDAGGDPDAVWIFQLTGSLYVGDGMRVLLTGGAKASNIFWVVGDGATLGSYSVFEGTLMAATSISLLTGASLNGRALCVSGAVDMDSSAITVPAASTNNISSLVLYNLHNALTTDGPALVHVLLLNGVFRAWVLEEDHAWRGWLSLGAVAWAVSTGNASWRIGDTGSHSGSQHAVVDWAALLIAPMNPGAPGTYSASNIGLSQDLNSRAVIAIAGPEWDVRPVTYRYDTTPPSGSFTLNNNTGFSTSVIVDLNMTATDTYGVAFYAASESLSFPEGWHPFAQRATLFLTPDDGRHVVWVRFMDTSGVMSAPINKSVVLDQVNPTGAIVLNNRSSSSNSLSVNLTILGFDEGGINGAWVSNDANLANAQFIDLKNATGVGLTAVSKTVTWALSPGDGTKTVYAQVEDVHTRTSGTPYLSDAILVDTTAPTLTASLPGAIVHGSTSYVNTSHLTVHVSASDASGVKDVQISEDPTFATNSSYTGAGDLAYDLPEVSGSRTLYVRSSDIYGLVSATTRLDFFVDVNAPIGSIVVENAADVTKTRTVDLQITATDNVGVDKMMLSTSLYFPGGVWVPFSTTASIDLSVGDGDSKTVYVRFMDVNGRISQAFVDTIAMDTTAPTGFIIINNGDIFTTDAVLNLALQAFDNFAGQLEMQVSTDPNFVNTSWQPFTDTVRFDSKTENGTVTVYYRVRDAVAWESITYQDSIIVRRATCTEQGNCPVVGGLPGFEAHASAMALLAAAGVGLASRRRWKQA